MNDRKNIGVIEFFNADSESFYCGFAKIKFTTQFDYIKSRGKSFRAFIKNPCAMNFQKGEIGCFDLSENVTENNCLLEVENIRKAEAQDLVNEKFLSDEKNYRTIEKILSHYNNHSLREEFLNFIFKSGKYFSISWINYDIECHFDSEVYVKKFLDVYKKNPKNLVGFSSVDEFNEFIYNRILKVTGNVNWQDEDKEICLNLWKEFVLTKREVFSAEIFLALWKEFDANQRFFLLQKAIKNFDDDDCEKIFDKFISGNADFILDGTIDFESVQKLSQCIQKSFYEVQCAEFLLNNLELFKIVDAGDDVTLLLIYALAKRYMDSELYGQIWKIFKQNKNIDTASPKVLVAFLIFEAGYLKMTGKATQGNISKVVKIFLDSFMLNPNAPEKFPDFQHIFPHCNEKRKIGENQEVKILFCEARKWFKPEYKTVNEDNILAYHSHQPEFEEIGYNYRAYHSGIPEWIEICTEIKQQVEIVEVDYCPPQRGYSKSCAHVDANFDLPVEKWTIIELAEKMNLTADMVKVFGMRKTFGESFNYIGAAYNRLWELREHLKCRERKCGKYMKPVKPPKFKAVSNLTELVYKAHHAIFGATTFQCKTANCPNNTPEKQVYLSHCWCCHSLIDSRDNKVTLANPRPAIPLEPEASREYKFYSCEVCGAGYQDSTSLGAQPFVLFGKEGEKHAVFPGTLCPKCLKCECGSQEFIIIPDQERGCYLQCAECGKEMIAPLTFEDNTNSEKAITRKMTCKKCGHKIEFNKNDLKYFAENYKYRDIDWAREK